MSHNWHHILQNTHSSTNSLHQFLSWICKRLYCAAVFLESCVDIKCWSCQVFTKSILKPLVTQLIAGHTLKASIRIIYSERYFANCNSFQVKKTCCSLCHNVPQQHSVRSGDQGLSVYTALSVTGQDRTTVFSKQIARTSCTMLGSEDTCCPLSLWCLLCSWRAFWWF